MSFQLKLVIKHPITLTYARYWGIENKFVHIEIRNSAVKWCILPNYTSRLKSKGNA